MGCDWAGIRMSEQLVEQRLWHHQLDGIAIPSDQDLVFEDGGGPHRPKFATFQGWTIALGSRPGPVTWPHRCPLFPGQYQEGGPTMGRLQDLPSVTYRPTYAIGPVITLLTERP